MRKNTNHRVATAIEPELPAEERSAEAATIAWMLCTLFALCAEVMGFAMRIYLHYAPPAELTMPRLLYLPTIAMAIALVSGCLCLVLTPIVYRVRKTPPPELITLVAVLIGAAPLATLLVAWLRS